MLYALPSLPLFVILPVVLGTRILDPVNLVVALTLYGVALLLRTAVDAFTSVGLGTREDALAVGHSPSQVFWRVALPLAGPPILAGVRVVSASTLSLVILAIPPLLAATYAGMESVDPDVVDGARAAGLRESQIALQVELPLAAPLLVGGIRSAALQVIATATISAFLGLGGWGRFILDGLAVRDYVQMLGGALLVCGLALLVDGIIIAIQRITLPVGVRIALGQQIP